MTRLVLHELVRQGWLMASDELNQYLPLALAFMDGKVTPDLYPTGKKEGEEDEVESRVFLVEPSGKTQRLYDREELAEGSVSVIPIRGPIMKYGSSSSYGMDEMARMATHADQLDQVRAHVLKMDTPGGSIYGAFHMLQAVESLKKPVIALVDNMCCSAGMMIAAPAKEIYSTHPLNRIGSIGAMVSWRDVRKQLEAEGVVIRDIYADKSTQKNHIARALQAGNDQPMKTEMLNPMNEAFHATIRKHFAGALAGMSAEDTEYLFSGADFFAEKGVSFGLLNGISTFEATIERAMALGEPARTNYQIG